MSEPIFTDFTEDLYGGLPEVYREYDALPEQDWALKKFVASIGDTADPVQALLDRFWFETPETGGTGFINGIDGNADLVNPARAEAEWLPWLAQILGVSLKGLSGATLEETITKQRLWMADPVEARRVGSRASLIQFGKAALTDSQYVEVFRRTAAAGAIGSAGEWDVAIVYRTEGAVLVDPAGAVIAAGQKPAGWLLVSRAVSNTWGDVHALGTWGAARARGTWADLHYDVL